MTTVVFAIGFAVLAACCFAGAIVLQHGAVRAANTGEFLGLRALGRAIRSRRWLAGAGLAVTGTGLHVTALSLAPLVIVQPIGVVGLVLTVLLGARARGTAVTSRTRAAVAAICVGTGGFVVLAAGAGASSTGGVPGSQLVAAGALAVSAAGLLARGRWRCLVLAASAAVLFGTGAALIRAASVTVIGSQAYAAGLGLAAESALLVVVGGWLVNQAYAAGPPAVVIAATTVIDPLTAVAIGIGVYGEAAHSTPAQAAAQVGFALLAVTGVIVLARSTPDPRPIPEELDMPNTGPQQRILVAADTFPPDVNGAANFADRLARGLAGRGHDVHVVCPAPAGTAAGTFSDGRLTVHRIPSLGTPFHPTFRVATPWRAARAVGPLLDRLRPDVVHVQSHFAVGRAVVHAATERGVPVIATNHFMPENLIGYAPIPRRLRAPLTRWAWRDLVQVYGRAQVVTAPTPRAARLLTANGLPGDPLAISCGIDLGHYPARRTASRDTTTTVLFVGRLDQEKNVDELIRAVAVLPDVRLEIVGDGACRKRLTTLADELGARSRVRFRGFVPDDELVAAYQHADVFCMPGTAELQSLATMEAMAAGLPVVAADAMALPHLVRPGVNGFLYPPGNVTLLAAALVALVDHPVARTVMGRASRQIVAEHDIRHTLDAFEGLYRTATGTAAETTAQSELAA
jgi:glycosyltransferase involved in cell wall biosynthesis